MNHDKWVDELEREWRAKGVYGPFKEVENITVTTPAISEDERFKAQLLRDIPYFHQLYAKYKDEKYLETAKNLGIAAMGIKRRLHRSLST